MSRLNNKFSSVFLVTLGRKGLSEESRPGEASARGVRVLLMGSIVLLDIVGGGLTTESGRFNRSTYTLPELL